MKKNIKKCFIIIILVITTIMINSCLSYATGTIKEDLGDLSSYEGTVENSERFLAKVGIVLGIIQAVGMIVAVAIIGVVGIKYMIGSIDEKAEYKKTAIAYVIGAIFVFSITTVPEIIYQFVHGN